MNLNSDRILVVASHPDDECLGAGGFISKSISEGSSVRVIFLSEGVNSRTTLRESLENRRLAATKALRILGCDDYDFYDFPDNLMDSVPLLEVVKIVEKNISDFDPTIVLTHFPHDLNIDHRITSQATLIASRPKTSSGVSALLYFEVQSSTEWNFGAPQFIPNVFVDISNSFESKVRALAEYQKEIENYPEARSIAGIEARNVIRGVTVGFEKAEAFQAAYIRG